MDALLLTAPDDALDGCAGNDTITVIVSSKSIIPEHPKVMLAQHHYGASSRGIIAGALQECPSAKKVAAILFLKQFAEAAIAAIISKDAHRTHASAAREESKSEESMCGIRFGGCFLRNHCLLVSPSGASCGEFEPIGE